MPTLTIDGLAAEGTHVRTANTDVLLIKAGSGPRTGLLACGYFSVETADRVGDAMAIVTGVKSFDDMLAANVVAVSRAAREAGVTEGMTGREALAHLASAT
ncbi:MAG: YunC family protein [Phycisphaeraceae bacterium]